MYMRDRQPSINVGPTRMPVTMVEQLDQAAAERDVPRAHLIREAIRKFLAALYEGDDV
jgi:metal-responsive CopG/Arc/MetJ family transcriptional regulator